MALLVLLLVVMGISFALLEALNASTLTRERERRTLEAMTQAKDALLGRAAADSTHPGSLPCPDADGDGRITVAGDYSGSQCKVYVGRLPWISLGVPELRDGDGEPLWYALSPSFRDAAGVIINSDTLGTMQVYAANGSSLLTEPGYSALAIVFSAGPPLAGQSRDAVAATCATTGTTIARNLCAQNYLDSAGSPLRSNWSPGGPFIAAPPSGTFNDQVLVITTRELMPVVEKRVALELIRILDGFRATWGNYPWADSNPTAVSGADANEGLNKGKLPLTLSYDSGENTTWGNLLSATIPWFSANKWYDVIFYAVARRESADEDKCRTTTAGHTCELNWLRVDGGVDTAVLFFTVGTPGTQTRPAAGYLPYLDDTGNHHDDANGDGCAGTGTPPPCNKDDDFITPTVSIMDRDRLYYLPRGSTTWVYR